VLLLLAELQVDFLSDPRLQIRVNEHLVHAQLIAERLSLKLLKRDLWEGLWVELEEPVLVFGQLDVVLRLQSQFGVGAVQTPS